MISTTTLHPLTNELSIVLLVHASFHHQTQQLIFSSCFEYCHFNSSGVYCHKYWSASSLHVNSNSSPFYLSDFHYWCRYCSSCWCSWRSIGVKLVGHSMSGCYVPCLPNPDQPSFLTLFGFIGIIFCSCFIILCLLFHFKSPMNYRQESPYHHQSYQSIINQQSLPVYLLDPFCMKWGILHITTSSSKSWLLPEPILSHLLFHTQISSKGHPNFIVSLNVLLTCQMTPLLSAILLLLLALLYSSLTSLTISNAAFLSMIAKVNEVVGIGNTIHKFVDTNGWFVYLPQVWLINCQDLPFCPQIFYQNCGGKSIIFRDWVEFDVFDFNFLIDWNSMCTEAEKKKYGFSLGRSVSFAGCYHFSDALCDWTTPTKETLDHEFSTYSKIWCPYVGTASKANLTGPEKTSVMAL